MGKRLIQQRRGKGSSTYRVNNHHVKGQVRLANHNGIIETLLRCPAHTAPLMVIAGLDGERALSPAPHGVRVGQDLSVSSQQIIPGNVLALKDIPEGTLVHNIECTPGDGGKLVRSSGVFAKVVAKTETEIRIKLPSKKEKILVPDCRAAIGVVAGSGRVEKPFLKAGTRYKRMRARNKLYPRVCGISMNAVDHPFGGKCSHIKGRPTQSPRGAPPGRKVGKIAPRRTGRRR